MPTMKAGCSAIPVVRILHAPLSTRRHLQPVQAARPANRRGVNQGDREIELHARTTPVLAANRRGVNQGDREGRPYNTRLTAKQATWYCTGDPRGRPG